MDLTRQTSLSLKALLLVLFFGYISGSISPPDVNLEEMANISIQLNKRAIQASSLHEQIFPMMVSQKIHHLSYQYKKPVDLICVFELSKDRLKKEQELQEVQSLFADIFEELQMMNDHDRLSIVLLDEHGGNSYAVPSTLINTTTRNQDQILSNIRKNIFTEKMSIERSLEIALEILSQRNEAHQTTGIFIYKGNRITEGEYGKIIMRKTEMEEIEKAKEKLGLQDKGLIIEILQDWPEYASNLLVESLAALRAGVVETRLVIQPEESQVFKGIQILNTYEWGILEEGWTPEDDGKFVGRYASFQHDLRRNVVVDLKIPPIAEALPSSSMEVKVASSQVIFILADGSQVVKSADLIVKVVGEEEELPREEEDKKAMEYFHEVWGGKILYTISGQPKTLAIQRDLREEQVRKTRELVRRFQESLDNSAMREGMAWLSESLTSSQSEFEESLISSPCSESF